VFIATLFATTRLRAEPDTSPPFTATVDRLAGLSLYFAPSGPATSLRALIARPMPFAPETVPLLETVAFVIVMPEYAPYFRLSSKPAPDPYAPMPVTALPSTVMSVKAALFSFSK